MEEITTVSAPAPTIALSDIDRVPLNGTGLRGRVFDSDFIRSIESIDTVIEEGAGDRYRFTASELSYRGGETLEDFLGEDAASLNTDGSAVDMSSIGFKFSGYVFIPEGRHEITIRSDDGFDLRLGNRDFSSFHGGRGTAPTTVAADFEGGLYKIDLSYYEGSGGQSLSFEIDGLTVDQSALYRSVEDFETNAAGGPTISANRYHPSTLLGEESRGGAQTLTGNGDHDEIKGNGGNDRLRGNGGDDQLEGGYGDDLLNGGGGNDVLDGGRGSDLLIGGEGNDLLISRSDAGEQRIGQLAIGQPTRNDPDNEVNNNRQKLKGYENQALKADDILSGGAGEDTFLITPLLNAKMDIIRKHVRSDGTINWQGVAGENNELHDHWVDSFGIDVITDYNKEEDHIAIIGHTAQIRDIEYRDTDGDGDRESIVTVISQQHGGGGAHTQDLLGQLIVHGDRVEEDDIEIDAGVFHGIVETWDEVAEALFPTGPSKVSQVGGQTIRGYDTRSPNGQDGPIVSNPEDFVDNPYSNSNQIDHADPTRAPVPDTSRGLDQLGFGEREQGETISGTSGNDVLVGYSEDDYAGLPGALSFWRFRGDDGVFENERDGPSAIAYQLIDNAAIIQSQPNMTDGPTGRSNSALLFDGQNDFAFIENDELFQVAQGTVALWVRPDDLSDDAIIVSKDKAGQGTGGHFRLGHDDDGRIFIRFSEGDGGGNKAWLSSVSYLEEGEWAHIAVGFDDEGLSVYVDGVKIPDFGWVREEGNVDRPGQYKEAYLINNEEPWVLGADTSGTEISGTAAAFATDRENLDDAFTGAIADFGIWGGFSLGGGGVYDEGVVATCGDNGGPLCFCGSGHGNSLTQEEIVRLFAEGPGAALDNPNGVFEIERKNDELNGGQGYDTIAGGGGNDLLRGGDGADSLIGGYGDDKLYGGNQADVIVGGRGSDLLVGGAGNDVLVSRSDVGEQRIGQLAIGDPTRGDPDGEVNMNRQKLYGWEDQPLVGDDIMVGGEGRDTFLINPQINAKRDIIMKHVEDDRTIDWAGVAGENAELHDHWVDSFGIDVIADYNADEDTIAIIGHTVDPTVEHKMIDSDGDGQLDKVVSVITVYSDQGANGGAHDDDLIGQIIVHGDLVDEDDLVVDAGVTHGIVGSVDQLQEAVAPTGRRKVSEDPDGNRILGYDTRDDQGNRGDIIENPNLYVDNRFADDVRYSNGIPDGLDAPQALLTRGTIGFDGNDDFRSIAHADRMARDEGTYAFSFRADRPGQGEQGLVSKDASGFVNGGHMSIYIDGRGDLVARFQSTNESIHLKADDIDIVAGREYHVAFTFGEDEVALYVDGVLQDSEDELADTSFAAGMTGNTETLVLGASSASRTSGEVNNIRDFFDGTISDFVLADRALTSVEAFQLAASGGDLDALSGGNGVPNADVEETLGIEVVGSGQSDIVTGTDEAEHLMGLAGHDSIYGNGGGDVIDGGKGNDFLVGFGSSDLLRGGLGNDMLSANGGKDRAYGGDGNDTVRGGNGDDRVYGGAGNDELRGNSGRDKLEGGAGDDMLGGAKGNDRLYGGGGDDELYGAVGRDILDGGAGRDELTGGRGADQFVLKAGDGWDVVTDFQDGVDFIDVSNLEGVSGVADLTVTDVNTGVVIDSENGAKLLLRDITAAQITDEDLILG